MTTYSDRIIAQTIAALRFNTDGIIPAIAQQYDSGEVLMMAWMNADAVRETLRTGRVCYWSRSRGALWRKGESSGQTQDLKRFGYDCDRDTILMAVDQKGVACHTGRRRCFFTWLGDEGAEITDPILVSPEDLYGKE
ncbi:MAG: phosphoribosyl-AMP cyclohydrolase [Alphaproteobacteria bacterium]|nr:MAG: phosphoribosyl-AMP cyclohydrolase [Alphaproteobacteria bacterium]